MEIMIESIRLIGYKTSKLYPKELRLVKYCDFETGEELDFITNITGQVELSGLEIANIYRHRWEKNLLTNITYNVTINLSNLQGVGTLAKFISII
jgi:hypothetical protein